LVADDKDRISDAIGDGIDRLNDVSSSRVAEAGLPQLLRERGGELATSYLRAIHQGCLHSLVLDFSIRGVPGGGITYIISP